MKTLSRNAMIAIIVFIAMANAVGQTPVVEKWLPVSCKVVSAVNAYHDALIRSGQNDEAAFHAKLDEAIKLEPNFFMARATKAWLFKKEIAAVLEMPADNLTPSELIARDVLKAINNGTIDLMPYAMALVKEYPNTMETYFYANYMMFKNNDWKNAGTFSKKMIELDPDFSVGYHWLGYSYLMTDNLDMAGKMFHKYAQLEPKEAKPYDALGEYYLNKGDFSKAAYNFEKAVELGREGSKYYAEKSRMILKALEFSPEQKEVWQTVENNWKYMHEQNLEAFTASIHNNYTGWNNLMAIPMNKQDFLNSFMYYKTKSYSLAPVSVAVTGDNAVVNYLYENSYERIKYRGKITEFYIREGGKWILLGDNASSTEVKENPVPEI